MAVPSPPVPLSATVLRVISLVCLLTSVAFMTAAPDDVRHVFEFGSVRLTRYAITQPLLIAGVVTQLVAIALQVREARRSRRGDETAPPRQ